MDGDLSALPPSAALPPIDPSASTSSSSSNPSTTAILPLSAPPRPPKNNNNNNNKSAPAAPTASIPPAPTASIPASTPPPPTAIPPASIPATLAKHTSLLSAALHTRLLSLSDEFFAPAINLISPHPPIRKPGVFVETGAWYDGWETRRHNVSCDDDAGEACDFVIFALGVRGRVKVVEVDTFGFVGNHPVAVRVLGASCEPDEVPRWNTTLLPLSPLNPDTRHAWLLPPVAPASTPGITHVKLQMFPDGGIARFRLYGDVLPSLPPPDANTAPIELSATLNGGAVAARSDEHFGHASNLLLPGRGVDMGDGWETRRSRGAGHEDWVVVKLGARGKVKRVVVDTLHFRGNFPRSVRVEGMDDGGDGAGGKEEEEGEEEQRERHERAETGMAGEGGFFERNEESVGVKPKEEDAGEQQQRQWKILGVIEQCEKDKEHEILLKEDGGMVCTHAKMVMIPDGGVKRFRVFGTRV